jgi:hypothetical protein
MKHKVSPVAVQCKHARDVMHSQGLQDMPLEAELHLSG